MTLWTFFGTIGSTIHMSLHQLELARERSRWNKTANCDRAQMAGRCIWDMVVDTKFACVISVQFNILHHCI